MFTLRPATEHDFPTIRELIHQVGINPMGLDWHRFLIAVDEQGRLVGCGQIKPHGDGSHELASIAVQPEWRRQGVARQIIEALIEQAPGVLYLTCRSALGPFYEKFGFGALERDAMPPYFKRLSRLAGLFSPVMKESLLVMKREGG